MRKSLTTDLGELLEHASSSPFQDNLEQDLLESLGMDPDKKVDLQSLGRRVVYEVDSLGRVDHESSPRWAD